MKIRIDGSAHTGNYRCECQCGTAWYGQALGERSWNYSPAMPIAECVVHIKVAHVNGALEIDFSQRFRDWLEAYWERDGMNRMSSSQEAALWSEPLQQTC